MNRSFFFAPTIKNVEQKSANSDPYNIIIFMQSHNFAILIDDPVDPVFVCLTFAYMHMDYGLISYPLSIYPIKKVCFFPSSF